MKTLDRNGNGQLCCAARRCFDEAHIATAQRNMPLRDLLARTSHHGYGGFAAKAELLTGIEGASNQPLWRIVLMGERARPSAPNSGVCHVDCLRMTRFPYRRWFASV